jgi:hypothetical protein
MVKNVYQSSRGEEEIILKNSRSRRKTTEDGKISHAHGLVEST